jgi:hypothetical protein
MVKGLPQGKTTVGENATCGYLWQAAYCFDWACWTLELKKLISVPVIIPPCLTAPNPCFLTLLSTG